MSFGKNKGYVLIRINDDYINDGDIEDEFKVYIEHPLRIMLAPKQYKCNSWKAVLDILIEEKVISDKTLCESVSFSAVDEFKLYENLWN